MSARWTGRSACWWTFRVRSCGWARSLLAASPRPPAPHSGSTSTAARATAARIRLEDETYGPDRAQTRVVVGGPLSDRKGVSVVGAVLPLSALTPKDRIDLAYALELGADWIALSFVQRPEDVEEIRGIVAGRAEVISKLEKPSAIEHLDAIVALSHAVMVARGDLGVEMPPEQTCRVADAWRLRQPRPKRLFRLQHVYIGQIACAVENAADLQQVCVHDVENEIAAMHHHSELHPRAPDAAAPPQENR